MRLVRWLLARAADIAHGPPARQPSFTSKEYPDQHRLARPVCKQILKHDRADLDRRLDRLLARQPTASAACKLRKGILGCRADLFRFVTRCDVPYTNNAGERALRPSVIFRQVTGCFRSTSGAKLDAAAAAVIATGRLRGLSALHALKTVLFPLSAPQDV